MNRPSEKQINEAKAFIRARVDAELSMKRNLELLLQKAAKRLAALASMHRMSVKEIVSSSSPAIRLRVRQIMDWLMFMIEQYVDTLAVAGREDDREEILLYIKRRQFGKTFSERLDGYVSGFVSNADSKDYSVKPLALLTAYAVTEGWMRWWGLQGMRNGAEGFFSFRGSSYPCSLCDSMVGWHPIDEYVGAWHPNCKCYFIFV